jgi:hypothetical protein
LLQTEIEDWPSRVELTAWSALFGSDAARGWKESNLTVVCARLVRGALRVPGLPSHATDDPRRDEAAAPPNPIRDDGRRVIERELPDEVLGCPVRTSLREALPRSTGSTGAGPERAAAVLADEKTV